MGLELYHHQQLRHISDLRDTEIETVPNSSFCTLLIHICVNDLHYCTYHLSTITICKQICVRNNNSHPVVLLPLNISKFAFKIGLLIFGLEIKKNWDESFYPNLKS